MWVLTGNGHELINLEHANRIFINEMNDAVLIRIDFGSGSDKVALLGKYFNEETAVNLITDIGQALESGRKCFIMPQNKYDVIMPKIMDSRVRRKGGS